MININFSNDYKKLAVVGYPINHSLSPLIHNFMIQTLALKYIYLPFSIKKDDYPKFLDSANILEIYGFNVTMPHKENAFLLCDEVFGDGKIAKSVNVVKKHNNKWEGYSTDGDGFNLSLNEKGISFNNKNILLIGAGGVASTILLTATKNNVKSVTILNRTIDNAKVISKNCSNVSIFKLNNEELIKHTAKNDIIINCTPLGMDGINSDFENFSFLNTSEKIICDLIYNPLETSLLKNAKKYNHTTINGLDMLLYQGMLALEIFTNTTFDKVEMKKKLVNKFFN